MTGLGALADALSIQLGRVASLEEDDDRRGRRIMGSGVGRSGGAGIRNSIGYDDDLPKRGGGRRIGNSSGASPFSSLAKAGRGGDAGPQVAVIKVASYAAGRRRVGALTDYLSRDGALQVENQSGQKLTGRVALDAELATWEPSFENRAPSKDVASLVIGVGAASDAEVSKGLKQAFVGRRSAWQRMEDEATSVRVVVILAGQDRRRLDVTAAGHAKIAETLSKAFEVNSDQVAVTLTSTGHGKAGLGYRLARLAGKGAFETSEGQTIGTPAEASALARDWSKGLNSRRVRDTMHLVTSAEAGTELGAFDKTTRAFLAERFEGHRYLFAVHQDRQHIHAHAVITMRRDDGIKLDPKIKDFADWREAFAEQARAHGINMVATRRLERAAAPAYKLKDIQLVEAAMRDGVPPPQKAKLRVEAKQQDAIHVPSRSEGKAAVAAARARSAASTNIVDRERLSIADVTAKFLDQLQVQALWGGDNAKEANMAKRPVDELQSDLKQMNAAATRIALLLPATSRPQFHALANPILENAASVVDQAMSMAAVDGLSSQANDVARQERREATEARQLADLASRAAEPLRRNEGPGSTERVEIEAIARSAERIAAREQREAIASTQIAQTVAAGEPIPAQANETEAVQKLREEQARLLREQKKTRSRERDREDEL